MIRLTDRLFAGTSDERTGNSGFDNGDQFFETDNEVTYIYVAGSWYRVTPASVEISGVVDVDATGQGDVPVSLSGTVTVDATGQGDVPVTLDGETVAVSGDISSQLQGYDGSNWQDIRIDASTHSLQTIDYAHHEIHAGSHFKAGLQDQSMATSDTLDLLFVTPDTTKWAHWTMTAQATGEVTVSLYEGATTSSDGTAVTIWNRNRNSSNTPTVTVTHTPTVTSVGTKMTEKWIGSEGFKEDISGEHRGDSEFILKQNTKYLVRLTAVSDGIKAAVGGDWYEHTDKS